MPLSVSLRPLKGTVAPGESCSFILTIIHHGSSESRVLPLITAQFCSKVIAHHSLSSFHRHPSPEPQFESSLRLKSDLFKLYATVPSSVLPRDLPQISDLSLPTSPNESIIYSTVPIAVAYNVTLSSSSTSFYLITINLPSFAEPTTAISFDQPPFLPVNVISFLSISILRSSLPVRTLNSLIVTTKRKNMEREYWDRSTAIKARELNKEVGEFLLNGRISEFIKIPIVKPKSITITLNNCDFLIIKYNSVINSGSILDINFSIIEPSQCSILAVETILSVTASSLSVENDLKRSIIKVSKEVIFQTDFVVSLNVPLECPSSRKLPRFELEYSLEIELVLAHPLQAPLSILLENNEDGVKKSIPVNKSSKVELELGVVVVGHDSIVDDGVARLEMR
ncbi:hypothetical protein RCL1_001644 [Eukaryota sp. TZLM3-RCL]